MQDTILRNFRKVVTSQFISVVSSKVGFRQRSTRQISGINFVQMLIKQIGSGRQMNYRNLNDSLSEINPRINISNQALSEYFYKQSSVDLIKSVYEEVFLFQKENLFKHCDKGLTNSMLDMFNRVLVEDSTFCVLSEKLKDKYKGAGGVTSKASLKIDLVHELKTATIVSLNISAGSVSDIHFGSLVLEELKTNDLVLRDLGYYKLGDLDRISKMGSYYISRFKVKTNVFLDEENRFPIDIGRYLEESCDVSSRGIVDTIVYLGDVKLKTRLVAYKVPPEVANERRRKVKKTASDSGKGTASEERLKLCDYVILITNIPMEKVQAETIGTIYRIRWSIELTFKTWKSHLNLQLNLTGYKVTRIECFVYAILIICLLTTLVHGWLKKIDPAGKEISLDKLVKWLLNKKGYIRLFCGAIWRLEAEIQMGIRNIRTQKRKRKTTLERVVSMEAYSEKYVANF